ncbi:unnamed protein product [Amaranthus hypochondriacus]
MCWVGFEVDKGFGILMGLHVRSLYEGKETKIGSLLLLGSHKENRCPGLRGNVAIDGSISIQHWCLLGRLHSHVCAILSYPGLLKTLLPFRVAEHPIAIHREKQAWGTHCLFIRVLYPICLYRLSLIMHCIFLLIA